MRASIAVVWDLLLPLGLGLFLMPLDPRISSLPLMFWILVQLLGASEQRRWALWPLLALLLLNTRLWWFNDPPHPASVQDGLVLVAGLLGATTVPQHRWLGILRLPLLALLPPLTSLGAKPWAPNPAVGANQGAYLLGLLFLLAVIWCWKERQRWLQGLAGGSAALAFVMLWQTGSRAGLIASAVALLIVVLRERAKAGTWRRDAALLLGAGALLYLARWLLFSTNSSLPGLKAGSDLGRLLSAECFAALPFSGSNRLLYGVGFDRVQELCQVPFQALVLQHAHNTYLQLWAGAGLLGVLALVLVLVLLIAQWRSVELEMPSGLCCSGQAALIYTLLQGCFDLSLLHWPVTLAFSGLLLGMPLAFCSASGQRMDRR